MVSLKEQFQEALAKYRTNAEEHMRTQNKTGFKWVSRIKHSGYKEGYYWGYQRRINKEIVALRSTTLIGLLEKVKANGYTWLVLDEEKAKMSVESEGLSWNVFRRYLSKEDFLEVEE